MLAARSSRGCLGLSAEPWQLRCPGQDAATIQSVAIRHVARPRAPHRMHSRRSPLPPDTQPGQKHNGWGTPHRRSIAWVCLSAAVALAGCSPTFNWRALQPEGTPLQALMPCKPEVAQRSIPLGEPTTELHMYSCEAGGFTFALSWADVGDGARAPQALAQLRRGALAAIRVDPARAEDPALTWAAQVPGGDHVQGLLADGIQHQQRPVRMKAVLFARGSQVFQAAVYGPMGADEASPPFFEGLRFP